MNDFQTQYFRPVTEQESLIRRDLKAVILAMKEKEYDPINQLVGYIQSDDPTYITNYQNARAIITRHSTDEILEELLRSFMSENNLK